MRRNKIISYHPLERKKTKPRYRFVVALLVLVLIIWGMVKSTEKSNSLKKNVVTKKTTTTQKTVSKKTEKIKIGLQAGHWKTEEMPDEFDKLKRQGGGGEVKGYLEWEINLEIANATAGILREKGFEVDVLPATVPIYYKADLFVAIHLDGNDYTSVSGFKSAGSAYDKTGKAEAISDTITEGYLAKTEMRQDTNITEDMTEYYAFNYDDHENAISDETPGVIFEAGFLTNSNDRWILLHKTQMVAQGLADGIIDYFDK